VRLDHEAALVGYKAEILDSIARSFGELLGQYINRGTK
jgi:hypothetical protein